MSKKPKSLGQIAHDAEMRYKPCSDSAGGEYEYIAQAVKRAVLSEIKPQLDAGTRDARDLAQCFIALSAISVCGKGKVQDLAEATVDAINARQNDPPLARSAAVLADGLLKRKAGK